MLTGVHACGDYMGREAHMCSPCKFPLHLRLARGWFSLLLWLWLLFHVLLFHVLLFHVLLFHVLLFYVLLFHVLLFHVLLLLLAEVGCSLQRFLKSSNFHGFSGCSCSFLRN
jgi:hypothetical protein